MDVFISYSTSDEQLAHQVYQHVLAEGVTAFLASMSLSPGTSWEPSIRQNLKDSHWVVFLASRAACGSPFVQQELGGAWLAEKQILPVIWDILPEEMPGFLKKYQVLDLRAGSLQDLKLAMSAIATKIKASKTTGWLLLGALALALLAAT